MAVVLNLIKENELYPKLKLMAHDLSCSSSCDTQRGQSKGMDSVLWPVSVYFLLPNRDKRGQRIIKVWILESRIKKEKKGFAWILYVRVTHDVVSWLSCKLYFISLLGSFSDLLFFRVTWILANSPKLHTWFAINCIKLIELKHIW